MLVPAHASPPELAVCTESVPPAAAAIPGRMGTTRDRGKPPPLSAQLLQPLLSMDPGLSRIYRKLLIRSFGAEMGAGQQHKECRRWMGLRNLNSTPQHMDWRDSCGEQHCRHSCSLSTLLSHPLVPASHSSFGENIKWSHLSFRAYQTFLFRDLVLRTNPFPFVGFYPWLLRFAFGLDWSRIFVVLPVSSSCSWVGKAGEESLKPSQICVRNLTGGE